MNKPSAVQVRPGQSHGMTGSSSGLLSRQHTLGSHISVQREAAGPGIDSRAPALVRDVLGSPGHPLDASTRASMEPRFGYDFSQVRVHTDERAAESARAVSANAYTAGNHVAFAAGKYAPETQGGQRLMAHELTHVVQQATGPVGGTQFAPGLVVSDPADPFEDRARKAASAVAAGPGGMTAQVATLPRSPISDSSLSLQRDGLGGAAAIAGIVGGLAGVGALIYAALQLGVAKHPPASASPTGGLTIANTSFNTLDKPVAGTDASTMKGATTNDKPLLYVDAPGTEHDSNNFTIGLQTKTDGHNVIEAITQEEHITGYRGGGDGATAQVTFVATPVSHADATAAAPAATPAPATLGADSASASPAASSAPVAAEAPAAKTEPAEVMLRFQGINTAKGEIQRFKGAYRVGGDGSVKSERAECRVTQGDQQDMEVGDVFISVGLGRTHTAKASQPAAAPKAAPVSTPGDLRPSASPSQPGDYEMPAGSPEMRMA
jgi:hypothetical protein